MDDPSLRGTAYVDVTGQPPQTEDIVMRHHLLACSLLVAASPALAVDGLLDSTFGNFATGRNVIAVDWGGIKEDTLAETLVAADGSIYMIGTSRAATNASSISITKLNPNGAVDTGFGTGGTVLSSLTAVVAHSATFDGTGNIVIAGSRSYIGNDKDFLVCRYNQLGQPAPFSALGAQNCTTVVFDVAGGNLTDVAEDVLVDAQGRLIVVGYAGVSVLNSRGAMARLLPDGTPDPAFGTASTPGKRTYEPTPGGINKFNAVARRADGKYIAVGESGDAASENGTGALFARLTVNGTPDPSYQNGAGFAIYSLNMGDPFHRDEVAKAITILGNGDMLMGGTADFGSTHTFAFVYKINPDDFANIDPSFGDTGVAKIGGGTSLDFGDMLVQSDGKIVMITTDKPTTDPRLEVQVIRLEPDGALDLSEFGNAGRTNINFMLSGDRDFGVSGALQNGRVIVGGHSLNAAPQNFDLTVARLSSDLIFKNGVD